MALVAFWIDLAENAKHQYLRLDVKFWHTTKSLATSTSLRLKDLFELVNGDSYTEYYSQQKTSIPYIRIADLSFKFGISDENLVYLDDSVSLKDEKILREDDLILATIGSVGKISLARDFRGGTFSNNTTLLRVRDKSNHNPAFYEKLFQTDLFQRYIAGVVSQKAQPNLQTYDLENIKVPLFSKPKQDALVAQIAPIEKNIRRLKAQIASPQAVISKVFADAFEFDLAGFEKRREAKFFEVDFADIANNSVLPFGIGIRRAAIELKPFVSKKFEYTSLGKVISLEYGSGLTELQRIEGDYPVVGSNGVVGYHNEYLLEGPSIIVGRKGSAGKVNYIEENNYPIDTCFYVRFLKEQNVLYFAYLLKFLQLSRLTLFKGVPGLNRYDVYNVKIPQVSLANQQEIVDEIKAELDEQEALKRQIQTERDRIDRIIEAAIQK